MYIGSFDPVSNRAGQEFIFEAIDDETDEPVDLSSADIVLEIRDPASRSTVLSATTANGKVTAIDTGTFRASFSSADMRALCAKQYEVGCTITNGDGGPVQFIIGTLPVLDGVVR